jgi:hypothetical protein
MNEGFTFSIEPRIMDAEGPAVKRGGQLRARM